MTRAGQGVSTHHKYFYSLLAKYFAEYIPPSVSATEIGQERQSITSLLPISKGGAFRFVPLEAVGQNSPIFSRADYPDRVILNSVLHYERDVQGFLERLRDNSPSHVRVLLAYYSMLWRPVLRLASWLGIRRQEPDENWLSNDDVDSLLTLAGYQRVVREARILIPIRIPVLSHLINRWIAPLPGIRSLALVRIVVARPVPAEQSAVAPSVSIVVPVRNEAGNLEALMRRLPKLGPSDELIVVEGHSTDNTWDRLQEVAAAHPATRVTCLRQPGRGKADAVRAGFARASNEILMILDGDLTVPPEDLPKFYRAIQGGVGDFINGSRLVYPMPKEAMRLANMVANKFFAVTFTFLIGQPLKDTLCGTKVLWRKDYLRIESARHELGEFDPFGDFDLLFGAARLGLKIAEVPVRYQARTFGTTNIRRWAHGLILLRMAAFAARKVKFI